MHRTPQPRSRDVPSVGTREFPWGQPRARSRILDSGVPDPRGATIMTSEPMRDPVTDPLLTPQNSALLVIDYQPSQIQAVSSIDHDLLTRNIVSVARLARTYGLPIVLSTVNVANGQGPTIPELKEVLSDSEEI